MEEEEEDSELKDSRWVSLMGWLAPNSGWDKVTGEGALRNCSVWAAGDGAEAPKMVILPPVAASSCCCISRHLACISASWCSRSWLRSSTWCFSASRASTS